MDPKKIEFLENCPANFFDQVHPQNGVKHPNFRFFCPPCPPGGQKGGSQGLQRQILKEFDPKMCAFLGPFFGSEKFRKFSTPSLRVLGQVTVGSTPGVPHVAPKDAPTPPVGEKVSQLAHFDLVGSQFPFWWPALTGVAQWWRDATALGVARGSLQAFCMFQQLSEFSGKKSRNRKKTKN